jgi:uncharacterized membrane protein YhfC
MDIVVRALNPFLMIAMPLALGIYIARRYRVDWRFFGIGAVIFIASQILHIPFNQWVLLPGLEKTGWGGDTTGLPYIIFTVSVGLSAGLFEESARFLAYKYWLKKSRTWKLGMMVGAGHGGIEAIFFGSLALYGFIQALTLRGADLSTIVTPEQLPLAQTQFQAYWAAPWHLAILGAVERLGALGAHLGFSIMVLQAIIRKQIRWYFLAVMCHTALNAIALIVLPAYGPYWTEAFVILAGALSLWAAFLLRTEEPDITPPTPLSISPLERLPLEELDSDQLEDSRYV